MVVLFGVKERGAPSSTNPNWRPLGHDDVPAESNTILNKYNYLIESMLTWIQHEVVGADRSAAALRQTSRYSLLEELSKNSELKTTTNQPQTFTP